MDPQSHRHCRATGGQQRRIPGGTERVGGGTGLGDGRLVGRQPRSHAARHLHPDDLFGSAPRVQARLGATNAVAFDLTAACSGFLFAVVTAAQYLRSGAMRRMLVVGADQLSRWVELGRSALLRALRRWRLVPWCWKLRDGQDDLDGFLLRSDGSRGEAFSICRLNQRQPLVDWPSQDHRRLTTPSR